MSGGKRSRACVHFLKGRCRFGDDCQFRHDPADLVHQPETQATRQAKKPREDESATACARSSLLKALLAKEVRAERSILLQCFRKLIAVEDERASGSG